MSNKSNKPSRKRSKPSPVGPKKPVGSKKLNPIVAEPEVELLSPPEGWGLGFALPAGIGILLVALYAYWPTLVWIEDSWRHEPDYSHGYLVLPLALLLCWNRWDSFPGILPSVSWAGVSLIGLAVLMRFVSRLIYADFLDAWSILPLTAGAVWLLFGFAAMRWALPAIAFLFLMIPLPYQAESMMSWRLQGVATDFSTALLRVFGQPAVSEGRVIWINDIQLQVEQACSGLRIFIGVAALGFFWAAMVQRSWLDRVVILCSVVPLAIFVNALRIVSIGVFYRLFDDSTISHQTTHDVSGYLMIPVAFGLLWFVKFYWERLYRPMEQMTARDFVPGARQAGAV